MKAILRIQSFFLMRHMPKLFYLCYELSLRTRVNSGILWTVILTLRYIYNVVP